LSDFFVKYDSIINPLKAKQQFPSQHFVAFKKDQFVRNYIASLDLLLTAKGRMSAEMKLLKFEELLLHLVETFPGKYCPSKRQNMRI
jgi:hypothetical protein